MHQRCRCRIPAGHPTRGSCTSRSVRSQSCAILPRLAGIHPRFATAALRAACGKPVLPSGRRVIAWLERQDRPTGSVLGCEVSHSTTIDLSVGSPLVTGDPRDNEALPLSARIEALMARREANVGIGRYGEARLLYSAPLFSSPQDRYGEHRTVHLGVDLFVPAGTAVLAPLDGVVHAVADNRAALDYGPVVILRHRTDAGDAFFTLYGHLRRASIVGLRPGQTIGAGATIAALGTPAENGGWPPHLHFQIVLDLLDLSTDFPGVCRATEVEVWRALSPDPSVMLRLPVGAQPFSPATRPPTARPAGTADLYERRRHSLGRNLSIAYRDPIHVARGWMQYLYDTAGRRYLDAYNNVPHVGHSHSRVVQAAAEQMLVLNTNTRYLHDTVAQFAERLTATLPDPLRVCYLRELRQRSERARAAPRAAHTRRAGSWFSRRRITATRRRSSTSARTSSTDRAEKGRRPGCTCARCPTRIEAHSSASDPRARRKYAESVRVASTSSSGGPLHRGERAERRRADHPARATICRRVYAIVRAAGGVCIADEVQTAFGRLGTSFYAFETQRVVPDIVVLGKPIGNGHPHWRGGDARRRLPSRSTTGWNSSARSAATLSRARSVSQCSTSWPRNACRPTRRTSASALISGLRALADRHRVDRRRSRIRVFLGVELVTSREYARAGDCEAAYVANRMREDGILFGTEGRSRTS